MKTPLLRTVTLVTALAAAWTPGHVGAQVGRGAEKAVVTGSADIVTTAEAAHERALRQALRLAVEQVAGVLVESETLSRNMALFEDNILTRTEGYVSDYEILDERVGDGVVTLEVEVKVVPGRLSGDLKSLGILLRRADYPLVSVELFASSNAELPPDVGPRLEDPNHHRGREPVGLVAVEAGALAHGPRQRLDGRDLPFEQRARLRGRHRRSRTHDLLFAHEVEWGAGEESNPSRRPAGGGKSWLTGMANNVRTGEQPGKSDRLSQASGGSAVA
jgi:hypothetical protein